MSSIFDIFPDLKQSRGKNKENQEDTFKSPGGIGFKEEKRENLLKKINKRSIELPLWKDK